MEHVLLRVLGDEEVEVDGGRDGDQLFVAEADLAAATGWQLKPQGLCKGEACVPVFDRAALGPEGWIDVAAFAAQVRHPVALDGPNATVAIGEPAAARGAALASLQAPDVTLPTVDGGTANVRDLSGRKRLVVSFASWCGCRHDLPAWQALHEKWEDKGFSVIAVAVDQTPEVVQPWVDEAAATFPVMVDADHRFVDAYGIRNVPTVVWIDEDDNIVQPNMAAFGNDQFIDFTGQPSAPHLEALERWVVDGEKPFDDDAAVREAQQLPTDDDQQARAEFRLALSLHRHGATEAAAAHFDEAGRLAPWDFTIRRGSMPLRGQDPFGEPFFELYEEWEKVGRPYYTEPTEPTEAPAPG
ncbi:TlpA family protein disulfide reductase [Aquihabitans sp. G128]|uniref:TlpA disulfide reductase family protein n=1 Tax=Aquihabitans sp. G128 TaxID=2849779 RepID=UPI001C24BDB7|nr:TlpA disulfide reductase family protein [Aquihabitans sp. G128]QXC59449.1 TlpA family protein disulfide reductase [Aquihabitans sp. G128]